MHARHTPEYAAAYYQAHKDELNRKKRARRAANRAKGLTAHGKERVNRDSDVGNMTLSQLIATQHLDIGHGHGERPLPFMEELGDGVSVWDDPTAEAVLTAD